MDQDDGDGIIGDDLKDIFWIQINSHFKGISFDIVELCYTINDYNYHVITSTTFGVSNEYTQNRRKAYV